MLNQKQFILAAVNILSIWAAQSEAAHFHIKDLAKTVLHMDTLSDWTISTVLVSFGYVMSFLLTAGAFEYTNPKVKDEKRMAIIKLELQYGIGSLVWISIYATTWLFLVDAHTPYYAYFATHDYTFTWLLINVAWYLFWMDTFFYWSHRLLHMTKPINLWFLVHRHHHQFVDPTAFGQDAVHPLEALLQGPVPHFLTFVFMPMHPLTASVLGFFTSIYAIAAHDGRRFDLNDHVKHHHYKNVNFGLYWGLWDYICGTRWSKQGHPDRIKFEWNYDGLAGDKIQKAE
ncbi:sterol desaturase [Capsaspora owczarzaki ATCC 30864]|uniref:Sterol desaturase n=1 Tax=Capsaspora owczarzaki (strain ATCC 30864) TaxID=595528 RepID=A0A0D2WQN7_CAPO3|nr:sterol desaturase [Capsaspora owczarzaki ATCC 30864]KJE94020.1 sterol desaturase [Capsaspora owczarzaki ATCC 30864]|eukprot:XP_004347469.1 sterol desaturase [Capsaspora owczarzaki ATCC 30864]